MSNTSPIVFPSVILNFSLVLFLLNYIFSICFNYSSCERVTLKHPEKGVFFWDDFTIVTKYREFINFLVLQLKGSFYEFPLLVAFVMMSC